MRLKALYILIIGLIFSTSCKKDFEEINQNPNAITDELIDPEYLFPKAVIAPFTQYNVGVNTELWALMTWTQMVASKNAVSLDEEFIYGGSDVNLVWETLYAQSLINTQQVIDLTNNNPKAVNINAIGRIWKVYVFHLITDLWGDVPYFDALKGNLEDKILYPKYDSQKDIYEDLLKELEQATNQFDASEKSINADIIYNGDITLWKKFANTLRLRLALRIYEANTTLASTHIQNVLNDNNLISSTSEAAVFEYAYGDNFRSPIAEGFRQSQVSELPSRLFVTKMLNDNDPRISFMINETKEYQVVG